jgi:tetratricopeptide (TPR) repeat protein
MQEITSLINRGELSEAERQCLQRLAKRPEDTTANFLLAVVLWRGARPAEALERCRETLARSPSNPGLLSDLGNLLRELGAYSEALASLDRSLALRPGNSGACYNRALVLRTMGREEEAGRAIASIGPGDPLFSRARFLRGAMRQDFGDMAGAEADFRDCIEAEPGHYRAWYALALTRRFEPGEEILGRLERQLTGTSGSPEARRHLLFALAKLLDDMGQYDAATDRVLEANRLAEARYDGESIERRLASLRREFSSFPSPGQPSSTAPLPVFIVGMPRSGTTLVESLLDRHPDIMALGELDILPGLISDFSRPADSDALLDMRSGYLDALPPESRHASAILDKMPGNFWRMGHIVLMFPDARIVHCQRDPRDVAISNFFTLFAEGNSFAYRLDSLAHYSACHDRIMSHWNQVIGDRIFPLDYAQLVSDPGATMKRLTGFLGFNWDPAMLDVPDKRRRIKTASMWQARQPVYTTSLERWRKYPGLAREFTASYEKYSRRLAKFD